MFVYSYDYESKSARMLAKALGAKFIKHEESKFVGDADKVVINWGCSDLPRQVRKCQVINDENAVNIAINKLLCLTQLDAFQDDTVPFTRDIEEVRTWLAEGSRVFARTKLTGKDGEGLKEVFLNEEIPTSRLYTKFVPSIKEYRINVCFFNVVSCQRKVLITETTKENDVRTSTNGYGFKWVTRGVPEEVQHAALSAVVHLDLDFGGVDVLWDGTCAYILEVNTAPELTPLSCKALADKIMEIYPPE